MPERICSARGIQILCSQATRQTGPLNAEHLTPAKRNSEKWHYRILHNSAEISLTPYAIIVSPNLRTFETGSGNRTVFSVPFNAAAFTEALHQDTDCDLDLIGMLPLQCPSKGGQHCVCSAAIVFKAVTEIMRIFLLAAMIKREGFETGETDDVGMTNVHRCNTSAVKKFGSDLDGLVMVENHPRVRNVDCRNCAFGRQLL